MLTSALADMKEQHSGFKVTPGVLSGATEIGCVYWAFAIRDNYVSGAIVIHCGYFFAAKGGYLDGLRALLCFSLGQLTGNVAVSKRDQRQC